MNDDDWGYCTACRRLEPVEKGLLAPHRAVGLALGDWAVNGANNRVACDGSGRKPSPMPDAEVEPMAGPCRCGWTGQPKHTHFPHSTSGADCD
jgi:hypothetical protein